MTQITASNVRPSECGVDLGVDVDIQIGDASGVVTLIEDHEGVWSAWGELSNWASSELHDGPLDDILDVARVLIASTGFKLPMFAVDGVDGGGVRDPAGGTWWPHEPTGEGDVLACYHADHGAGEWSA